MAAPRVAPCKTESWRRFMQPPGKRFPSASGLALSCLALATTPICRFSKCWRATMAFGNWCVPPSRSSSSLAHSSPSWGGVRWRACGWLPSRRQTLTSSTLSKRAGSEAHSYLVTTDVGCATFTILLLLAVWKYVQRPGLTRLALCGLAMGAALTAKFSAIFLLPVVGVLLLAAVWFSPRDQAAAGGQRTPSPDDRCPCGSGRKYKNCHQAERQGKRRAIDYRSE